MLERIREGSQGVTAKVILGLVILTFAFAGIGGYFTNSGAAPVAVVNGEEISRQAFEQKYQNNRARMEQQFGNMFATLAADENYMRNFREGVLDQLVSEQLQTEMADNIGLYTSDAKIIDTIRNMPEFQVDGKFDNERYRMVLRQVGYQVPAFRDYLRVENTRRQVSQALISSDFFLDGEVKSHELLDKQARDIEYVVFKQADYKDKVEISDEDKKAFYEANLDKYETQERVSLQYVELNIEDIMKTIPVADSDIERYYQENMGAYRKNVARRRASHILIEFGDDEDAARAKAEELLAEIKSGADFAEVAKFDSMDSFSAENGGDLDWFEQGVMDEAFDEAVFAMANVNDVSDIVTTESGFHIIKLTGNEPEAFKSFEEVKTEVADTLKRNQASDIFAEQQEEFVNLAFEVPESLEDAAEAIGATVQETALFSRFAAPPVVNYPEVLATVFKPDFIEEGINSEAIEVKADHFIVVRINQHEPTRFREMSEVEDQIVTALTTEKSQELAKAEADSIRAELSSEGKLTEQDKVKGMTIVTKAGVVRTTSDVDAALRGEVFKMPHPEAGKISAEVIKMGNGDYALVALSQVTDGVLPEDTKVTGDRITSQKSQRAYRDFIKSLEDGAKIEKMEVAAN